MLQDSAKLLEKILVLVLITLKFLVFCLFAVLILSLYVIVEEALQHRPAPSWEVLHVGVEVSPVRFVKVLEQLLFLLRPVRVDPC